MTKYLRELPRVTSYEQAERHYNRIKPYNGKHITKDQNLRPYGSRSHCWYNIVKGRGYYALHCGWPHSTWGGDMVRWYKNGTIKVYPNHSLGQPMIHETYRSALPSDLYIENYRHSRYLAVGGEYFRLTMMHNKPYAVRKVDGKWEVDPKTVHQEYKYSVKAKIKGYIQRVAGPFVTYLQTMAPLFIATTDNKPNSYRGWGFNWKEVLSNRDRWYDEAHRTWKQYCLAWDFKARGYGYNGGAVSRSIVLSMITKELVRSDSGAYERTPIGNVLHYDVHRYRYESALTMEKHRRQQKKKGK